MLNLLFTPRSRRTQAHSCTAPLGRRRERRRELRPTHKTISRGQQATNRRRRRAWQWTRTYLRPMTRKRRRAQQSPCHPRHTRCSTHRSDECNHARRCCHHVVACCHHDALHCCTPSAMKAPATPIPASNSGADGDRSTVQVHHPQPYHHNTIIIPSQLQHSSEGTTARARTPWHPPNRGWCEPAMCTHRHHDHEDEQPPHDEPEHGRQTKHTRAQTSRGRCSCSRPQEPRRHVCNELVARLPPTKRALSRTVY